MLYAEIESEEALKVYADHQAHLDFKKLTAPYSTGASCFVPFPVSIGAYWVLMRTPPLVLCAQMSWRLTSRFRGILSYCERDWETRRTESRTRRFSAFSPSWESSDRESWT